MLHPGGGEKIEKKREAQVVKTLFKFYGDLWNRLLIESPEIDTASLSERIGLRMSEYIAAIGGWGALPYILFEGQQGDFIGVTKAQFKKRELQQDGFFIMFYIKNAAYRNL